MTKKNILEIVVAALIIFAAAFGGLKYFATVTQLSSVDKRISDKLILTDMRLEQKIVGDGVLNLTLQMGQLEAKYGSQDSSTWNNENDRVRYKKLELQVEQLKKKQDVLIQRQTNKQ